MSKTREAKRQGLFAKLCALFLPHVRETIAPDDSRLNTFQVLSKKERQTRIDKLAEFDAGHIVIGWMRVLLAHEDSLKEGNLSQYLLPSRATHIQLLNEFDECTNPSLRLDRVMAVLRRVGIVNAPGRREPLYGPARKLARIWYPGGISSLRSVSDV